MTEQECRRRMAAARRAILATVDPEGTPHLVPITFAVDDDVIVTAVDQKPKRTTDLKRLRNIRANPRVAVLTDHYDEDWETLWWVRADGEASVLTGGGEHADVPQPLLASRYPQYQQRPPVGPVIRIVVDRWTGWSAADR